jgi:hypothetical protein
MGGAYNAGLVDGQVATAHMSTVLAERKTTHCFVAYLLLFLTTHFLLSIIIALQKVFDINGWVVLGTVLAERKTTHCFVAYLLFLKNQQP